MDNFVVAYENANDSNKGYYVTGSINADSVITIGTARKFVDAEIEHETALTYDPDTQRLIGLYIDASSDDGFCFVSETDGTEITTNLATDGESYIGIAKKTSTANSEAQITTFGGVDNQQSGLTAGQKYFVQSDGTFSTTAGSPSIVAGKALSATKLLISE